MDKEFGHEFGRNGLSSNEILRSAGCKQTAAMQSAASTWPFSHRRVRAQRAKTRTSLDEMGIRMLRYDQVPLADTERRRRKFPISAKRCPGQMELDFTSRGAPRPIREYLYEVVVRLTEVRGE